MLEQREDMQVSERQIESPAWSPAQLVAIVIGAFFVIVGAVTLARTGIGGSMLAPHVSTMGLHHTPLLGAFELGFGLLMVMAGAIPGAGRGTMTLLGGIALGAGIVILIQPASFHRALGVHAANGWLYVFTGIAAMVAAMAAPVIFGRDARVVGQERDLMRRW
jgi:hypothetical protein